jgi:hypothetical protein
MKTTLEWRAREALVRSGRQVGEPCPAPCNGQSLLMPGCDRLSLTGTGRYDVIAEADATSETLRLRPSGCIRCQRGVTQVKADATCASSSKAPRQVSGLGPEARKRCDLLAGHVQGSGRLRASSW